MGRKRPVAGGGVSLVARESGAGVHSARHKGHKVPAPAPGAMPKKKKKSAAIVPMPARTPRPAEPPCAPKAPGVRTPAVVPAGPPLPAADEIMEADSRCWDPQVSAMAAAARIAPLGTAVGRLEPLAVECARAQAVRRLRLGLNEQVRAQKLTAPVGAFERWHYGWISMAHTTLDPLLPETTAPAADATLMAELESAGADGAAASRVAAQLRQLAEAEAARLAAIVRRSRGAPDLEASAEAIELREGPDHASTSASGCDREGLSHLVIGVEGELAVGPLKIERGQLAKLRAMHEQCAAAATSTATEARFLHDLARLLLRYKTLGGSGFQASLSGGAFAVLRAAFGVTSECFASPLNARSVPFCSAFADVDAPFGSVGSFLSTHPLEGSFEANPPFAPALIEAMSAHMERLLGAAEAAARPLLFVIIVGASAALRRHVAWASLQALVAGRFGRAQWLVPLHAHGYTEGHAHIQRGGPMEARRLSSCDTAVFVVASSTAAARWPATAAAEASLRAAMRLAIPRKIKQRASKANRQAHAAKLKRKRGAGASGSDAAAAHGPAKRKRGAGGRAAGA